MSGPVIDRLVERPELLDLLELTVDLADRELAPHAAAAEASGTFPRETFRLLGRAGLLSLPYPEDVGGSGVPYETYLQVLEEVAARWASVAVGISVHALACYPVHAFGDEQQRRWLAEMLAGDTLGAYCLSEPHAGSDPAAIRTTARPTDVGGWTLSGTKAWVTHGGEADFYNVFATTGDGISCFFVRAGTAGLSFGAPEQKMGLTGSTTASVYLDEVRLPADALIGGVGAGMRIALSALDRGRLGIAACATGLSEAALSAAVAYARDREAFGKPIIEHQGLAFLLADMAAAVDASRALVSDGARRLDAGRPFSRHASTAKLIATDNAMKVTTDAVQVLGGYGYVRDFALERYMREAKVMQIFEGTNQIQRMVIGRHLAKAPA